MKEEAARDWRKLRAVTTGGACGDGLWRTFLRRTTGKEWGACGLGAAWWHVHFLTGGWMVVGHVESTLVFRKYSGICRVLLTPSSQVTWERKGRCICLWHMSVSIYVHVTASAGKMQGIVQGLRAKKYSEILWVFGSSLSWSIWALEYNTANTPWRSILTDHSERTHYSLRTHHVKLQSLHVLSQTPPH